MSVLTIAYTILFYFAALTFLLGVGGKVVQYARTPAPLKIPTTPAPLTKAGVGWRLSKEVFLFSSLFKADKTLWVFAILFHGGMSLALLQHGQYTWAPYGAVAMIIGLVYLLARRVFSEPIRYISSPSDYLMLLLLLGIATSGIFMRLVAPTDVLAAKAFVIGLIYFDWQPLPSDPNLLVHLTLVLLLMIVFPVSKLLHAPGVFFSPTRNQVDNAREKRHLAAWAAPLDQTRSK